VQDEEATENSSSGVEAGSVVGSEAELTDTHIQIMEQDKMILQLKEMIRDREKVLSEKDGELKVCSSINLTIYYSSISKDKREGNLNKLYRSSILLQIYFYCFSLVTDNIVYL